MKEPDKSVQSSKEIAVIQKTTELIRFLKSWDNAKLKALLAEIEKDLMACEPDFASRQVAVLQSVRARLSGLSSSLANESTAESSPSEETAELDATEFGEPISSGLSLVTCCMNRSENLLKALRSWIACKEIDQIVIVDWSSKKSVHEEIKAAGLLDPRVLVVRVDGQPRWILSYAYNLGFRVASRDQILKTDADIVIESEFFRSNPLLPGTFVSGDWRVANEGQEHVNGFFMVRRKDLLSVKGFNEYITTYGWDDDDLYFRLEQQGFNRIRIKTGGIHHIPHGNEQRVAPSAKSNAWEELLADPGMKIMSNKFVAAVSPDWDEQKYFVPFDLSRLSSSLLLCKQRHESWHRVPEYALEDAHHYGAALALSWTTELSALFITKLNLRALLEARCSRKEISRWDARLAAMSAQPVHWHPRLLVVRFEADVDAKNRLAALRELHRRVLGAEMTLLLEPPDYQLIKQLAVEEGVISTIMSMPDNYGLFDIPSFDSSRLHHIPAICKDQPCGMVTLSKSDADSLNVAVKRPKLPRKLKLFLDAQHGLGNRMRALGSAAAVARATERELVLIWAPDVHCDCFFTDLFEYDGNVISTVAEDSIADAVHVSYMTTEPGACKDAPLELIPEKDFYIKSAYVLNHPASTWNEENQLLRRLVPVQSVLDLVDSISTNTHVGAHIRFEGAHGTDTNAYDSPENWLADEHKQIVSWREKSAPARFAARIDALIQSDPTLNVFLAADRPETYQTFHARYGDRVLSLSRDHYNRSKEQLYFALADALILSRCKYLLGSTWSSFTELAKRLSKIQQTVEMSGTDF